MNIPVELSGGPLDGHQCKVDVTDPARNVWLFRDSSGEHADPKEVHAYAFKGTSTTSGSHWILHHLQKVAWSPSSTAH